MILALPYYEEKWRDIPQGRGFYQINNTGLVKSLERIVRFGNQQRVIKEHIIVPRIRKTQSGYKQRIIEIFGKTYVVARLVALAFADLVEWDEEAKGKPFDEIEVDHINTDPTDNRVENLKWVTHKGQYENPLTKQHICESHKGRKMLKGKDCILSKPVLQFRKNMVLIREYGSIREAEMETGIDHVCISRCCQGKYKTAGGYIWKYKN